MLAAGVKAHQTREKARHWRQHCWLMLIVASCSAACAQTALPDAPAPQTELASAVPEASAPASSGADVTDASSALPLAPIATLFPDGGGQQTFPPTARSRRGMTMPGLQPSYVPLPRGCHTRACSEAPPRRSCCEQLSPAFADYLQHNAVHIYTPRELALLAAHGVSDPFNLLTILYTSAYTVATDSHSPYGPGGMGIARLSGVSLTQDMTGEFFGTFLIPSIDHQDPHYHRMPNASLPRRIAHCVYQIFWTESDTGKGMPNYSTILGAMADEAVGIMYVPYQQTGWGPSASRIATNWATGPIGNFVTEFVPDVARHINFNVVFLQRIVNRVAVEEGGGPS